MRFGYVTIATNEKYLKGAYKLYQSYLKTNSKYPFYCMVWKETNTQNYEDLPTIIIPKFLPTNKRFGYNPPIGVFARICAWLLKDFDYVLCLDSDFVFYQNIDNIIDIYLQTPNNDVIMPIVKNPVNAHDYYNCAWMFIKPNEKTFIKATLYFNISAHEGEVITYMADNNDIKITDCTNLPNLFDYIFHFNNWYINQKYWENILGNKIYDMIISNPDIVPVIKEIQVLIAIQPYEFMRFDKDDNPVQWKFKTPY